MNFRFKTDSIRVIFPLFFTILYGIWCISLDYSIIPSGYYITVLLPWVFLIDFCVFLWRPFFENRSPFIVTYCVVQACRFIVLSIVTISSFQSGLGYWIFGRANFSNNLLAESGVLMITELLCTSIVIYFSSAKNRKMKENKELVLSYSSKIYYLCFISAFLLIILVPQIRSGIIFFIGYDSEGDVEKLSTLILLVREFFVTSKYFLLFAVIKSLFKTKNISNQENDKNRYLKMIIILFICLIVVSLRISTNRKRIIADAVACVVIVIAIFPKYKRHILSFMGILSLLLVVSTSIFRGATESFETFGSDLFSPASLQSYLCGQYNISCALETANIFGSEINIGTLIYSSFRSFFGIGTLISSLNIPTLSYYYNQISSTGYSYLRESQIIPMVGEGAIYFSSAFAPLLSMFFVYLGVVVDRIYQKTSWLEYRFICVVLAVYFGQALSLSSNIIINNVTFKLALFIPIVIIANSFSRVRKKKL